MPVRYVFLLDYSPATCLAGVDFRIEKLREKMPRMEKDFGPAFRQWIKDFPKE